MIFLDSIKVMPDYGAHIRELTDDCIGLVMHKDVMALASELAVRDEAALRSTSLRLFMPAKRCWFEHSDEYGRLGFFFQGTDNVTQGEGLAFFQRKDDEGPTVHPLNYDLENSIIRSGFSPKLRNLMMHMGQRNSGPADPIAANVAMHSFAPLVFALLSLINSPKIIRQDPARIDRLNRKRAAAGRYTFHPHHVCTLNVDRSTFRVGATDGGDGATRALHHVRAHLRLQHGRYVIVKPHWRGDPKVGIIDTSYEIERNGSKW